MEKFQFNLKIQSMDYIFAIKWQVQIIYFLSQHLC